MFYLLVYKGAINYILSRAFIKENLLLLGCSIRIFIFFEQKFKTFQKSDSGSVGRIFVHEVKIPNNDSIS